MRLKIWTGLATLALAQPAFSVTTQTYSYDARTRLTKTCQATGWDGRRTDYALDAASNRSNLTSFNTLLIIAVGSRIYSPDTRFYLTMQSDGNFVLYGPSGLLWHSNTAGSSASYVAFQGGGNLVLYTAGGTVIWNSSTWGHDCSTLTVQNDGNVVIRSMDGTALWATNTGGH